MKSLSPDLLRAGAGLLAGAALLAACSSSPGPSAHSRSSTTTSLAGVGAQATTTSTASVAPGSTGTIASSTTSTTNPPEAAGGGPITVQSPARGARIGSPLTVSGTSHLGRQAIQVVLSDGSGNPLCQATAQPSSAGSFTVTMRFAAASPGPGSLALYVAGSGGARNDLIQVAVQLSD
jgi:hypothetical protein